MSITSEVSFFLLCKGGGGGGGGGEVGEVEGGG